MELRLRQLVAQIEGLSIKGTREVEITGLCASSPLVCPGNLFIAKRGRVHDGTCFIRSAVASGASAVVSDLYDPFLEVTQLIHPDVASIEALLAARFYSHPSKRLKVVGITGTSGKTTVSSMVYHILGVLGIRAGLISTVRSLVGDYCYETNLTTPDVITCHKLLREMVEVGSKTAVVEVSSHGLDQGRVAGIDFDVAAFTNLSQDHLDYHGTMEKYAQAKGKLFSALPADGWAILNSDDPVSFPTQARVLTYGIDRGADLIAKELALSEKGSRFLATFNGERAAVVSKLLGRFNVSNTLAALGVCIALGAPLADCARAVASFGGVAGRLQRVESRLKFSIFVDFAHCPDGLEKVLKTLQTFKRGKLILVFGAGGERDEAKRPLMGSVASRYADLAIVTSDNPRSEDPAAIAEAIAAGFEGGAPLIELNRKRAIERAVECASEGDQILIAGKGHEKQQIFAHQVVAFDDVEVAGEACLKREKLLRC